MKPKDIQTEWVKHLPRGSKEYEEFKSLVKNSTQILTRMDEILRDQEEAIDKVELSEKQYSTPNWDVLQAHRNGRKEQINNIRALLQHL